MTLQEAKSIARHAVKSAVEMARDVSSWSAWQRRTNVWRKVTNLAWGAKRLRSGTANERTSTAAAKAD
jgi:hypothetical protein